MIRLSQAIAALMTCTLAAGAAGGIAGAAVGTFAPSFVGWIQAQAPMGAPKMANPAEFGLGLGIVCGLLLGSAAGLVLVLGLAFRDAWLLRVGISVEPKATGATADPL